MQTLTRVDKRQIIEVAPDGESQQVLGLLWTVSLYVAQPAS